LIALQRQVVGVEFFVGTHSCRKLLFDLNPANAKNNYFFSRRSERCGASGPDISSAARGAFWIKEFYVDA